MSISQPKLTLRRPTLSDKTTILEMIAEFKQAESAMDGGFYQMGEEYENWLEKLQLAEAGLALPEGFVPYIQYVSFDERGKAVGFLNLRLRLNDFLLNKGGHIGYSIRPSQRGKGFAKKQLDQGLQEAISKNNFPNSSDLLTRKRSQPQNDSSLRRRLRGYPRRGRTLLD